MNLQHLAKAGPGPGWQQPLCIGLLASSPVADFLLRGRLTTGAMYPPHPVPQGHILLRRGQAPKLGVTAL